MSASPASRTHPGQTGGTAPSDEDRRHEQELGDDPAAAPTQPSEMNWKSSNPSARMRSTSSAGGSESIASAISALPPSFVRDTAMLAMFTPASPNIVPTRPITPGTSS